MSATLDKWASKKEIEAFYKKTPGLQLTENRKRKKIEQLREELQAGGYFGGAPVAAQAAAEPTINIIGFQSDMPQQYPTASAVDVELSGFGGLSLNTPAPEPEPAPAPAPSPSPPTSSVSYPEDYSKGRKVAEMRDWLSTHVPNTSIPAKKREIRDLYNEIYQRINFPEPEPEPEPVQVPLAAEEEFPEVDDPWGAPEGGWTLADISDSSSEEEEEKSDDPNDLWDDMDFFAEIDGKKYFIGDDGEDGFKVYDKDRYYVGDLDDMMGSIIFVNDGNPLPGAKPLYDPSDKPTPEQQGYINAIYEREKTARKKERLDEKLAEAQREIDYFANQRLAATRQQEQKEKFDKEERRLRLKRERREKKEAQLQARKVEQITNPDPDEEDPLTIYNYEMDDLLIDEETSKIYNPVTREEIGYYDDYHEQIFFTETWIGSHVNNIREPIKIDGIDFLSEPWVNGRRDLYNTKGHFLTTEIDGGVIDWSKVGQKLEEQGHTLYPFKVFVKYAAEMGLDPPKRPPTYPAAISMWRGIRDDEKAEEERASTGRILDRDRKEQDRLQELKENPVEFEGYTLDDISYLRRKEAIDDEERNGYLKEEQILYMETTMAPKKVGTFKEDSWSYEYGEDAIDWVSVKYKQRHIKKSEKY